MLPRRTSRPQTIESSGMSYIEVGDGLKTWDGRKMNTKCIVVREFTNNR